MFRLDPIRQADPAEACATVAGGAAVADAVQKASKSARRNASLALARRSNSRSLRSWSRFNTESRRNTWARVLGFFTAISGRGFGWCNCSWWGSCCRCSPKASHQVDSSYWETFDLKQCHFSKRRRILNVTVGFGWCNLAGGAAVADATQRRHARLILMVKQYLGIWRSWVSALRCGNDLQRTWKVLLKNK